MASTDGDVSCTVPGYVCVFPVLSPHFNKCIQISLMSNSCLGCPPGNHCNY